MARLTITLSDETHRRLKVQAAMKDRTIGDLIEEELSIAREARRQRAMDALRQMQEAASESVAGMTDDEIMEMAVEATREVRRQKAAERESGQARR